MLYVIRCNTISKVPHWKQSNSHKDTITQVYLETIKQFIARSKIGKERFEDVFPPFSWSSYTSRDSGKDSRSQWNENLRGLEGKRERERGERTIDIYGIKREEDEETKFRNDRQSASSTE